MTEFGFLGLLIPSSRLSLASLADELLLIWLAGDPAQFRDQVVFLPI